MLQVEFSCIKFILMLLVSEPRTGIQGMFERIYAVRSEHSQYPALSFKWG